MKAFLFNGEEYTDLNELGIAYANHYDLALQSIQEKSFLKFVSKFKKHKKRIKEILFQTRYLQNALTILIYTITEDHLFTLGHRFYLSLKECIQDLKKNSAFLFFAEDYGFTYTFLNEVEDEKLKADLQAFEKNSNDAFALEYMANYYTYDSLDSLESYYEAVQGSELFKRYLGVFQNTDFLKILAQKTSLQEVLDMKNSYCPIFKGFILSQMEEEKVLSILENSFYMTLLQDYKQYKYKGDIAKKNYRSFKGLKKKYKKYAKLSYIDKVKWHEDFYFCYLKFVDSSKEERIISKEEKFDFSVPYCETLVSLKCLEDFKLLPDIDKEYEPLQYVEYDLNGFVKSFRNHYYFSFWGILFLLLFGAYYGLCFFIEPLEPAIHSNLMHPSNLLFFIGSGISFLFFITILILRSSAKRKYRCLCKLAYYRKHRDMLTEKQYMEFERISALEKSYAAKIDRYYRFYGGKAMGGLALVISTILIGIVHNYLSHSIELFQKAEELLDAKFYFLIIPAVVCLVLGFLRHKKTAWSIWLTFLLSAGLTIGFIFII